MSDFAKLMRVIGVLAVTIGLAVLCAWLWSRQGDVTPVAATPASAQTALPTTPAPGPLAVAQTLPVPADLAHPKVSMPNPTNAPAADWDGKLDDILLGDDDENVKADKILALIPGAPPDAQQELAQHLVNMVQDDHYDGTAELLTNAATSVDVSTVLMNDLLNRSNTLKLPMLLAIARNDTHPLKDQALDLLGLLTQEDDGTNWDQWSSTIDTWLNDNPQ